MDEAQRMIQDALRREAEKQHNHDVAAHDEEVDSMTHKQWLAEQRRESRNKSNSLLMQCYFLIGGIVTENTHSWQNPAGKLECYPR